MKQKLVRMRGKDGPVIESVLEYNAQDSFEANLTAKGDMTCSIKLYRENMGPEVVAEAWAVYREWERVFKGKKTSPDFQ